MLGNIFVDESQQLRQVEPPIPEVNLSVRIIWPLKTHEWSSIQSNELGTQESDIFCL